MSKTKFTDATPLTADHFNSFVQESQIVQGPGFNNNVVMSQAAVTAALNYLGYGYTGYGYGSGYGYGYGSSCIPAAKSNSVFYATGKLQDNLINACGDTPFHAEGPGTTVIVKMSDNYTSQNGNARLRAGDIEKEIVVLSDTNGNAGIRKIYYNTSVPGGSNDIYSRNVFLKGASYEFYYDGQYWVLKNTVVSSGKNYKIWADGFVEQWGISGAASGKAVTLSFGVPYTSNDYIVALSGNAVTRPSTVMMSNQANLGVSAKTVNYMVVVNDLDGSYVHWYVRGY